MAGAQVPPAAGEGLARAERLRRRADYLRCYRAGRRRQGRLLLLYFAPNALGHPRLGITASRKVGKAVLRHRLKRRVREVYRRWSERPRLPALDVVVHLEPRSGSATFPELRQDLERSLRGLLAAPASPPAGSPAR